MASEILFEPPREELSKTLAIIVVLFSWTWALSAQEVSVRPETQQNYLKLCSGCHGEDARGTQQGPGLAGSASMRKRTLQSVRNIIRNGIPSAGMPGFDLGSGALDELANFAVSLNALASASVIPGDAAAGKQFFFGKGKCASCHMVYGEGAPLGPDLSSIAAEMTVEELRESVIHPDSRIAPGYETVRVRLTNGQTLEGFARSRSAFELVLQDLKGAFHPVLMDRVSSITEEKKSVMPAIETKSDDLQNVIAFLGRLTGVKPGAIISPAMPLTGGVDFPRIQNPKQGDWVTYNGELSGNRYSQVKEINTATVNKLSLKWSFSVPLWAQSFPDTPYFRENMRYFGLETVPIVADGIMYATGPNQVFALDARTGHEIWHYSRPRTPGLVSDASLGTNRGVAILEDNLFMVTDNAHLIAINRITGKPVWEAVMPEELQKYGGTMAPLVVKNLVVAGVSGGDWGIRGFIAAYEAATGKLVWRHWTVPTVGEAGYETWKGSSVKYGGGATWLTGSYDQETDTLYWATGNPWPNSDDRERGGDNLFTDCVLALDPATGKVKWFYQFTPHDVHDWDSNEPNVVVDASFHGQPRKLLLHADRNGFFYVFDRTDGKLLLAQPFTRKMTWAKGIGSDGRPEMATEKDVSCPDHATNWNGTVYSPTTHLYYVMVLEKCSAKLSPGSWKKNPTRAESGTKYLRALDIETGKIAWEVPQSGPVDGKRYAGILGTAGGVLFYGDPTGDFIAADERNGKTLWRIPLGATIKTSPMTYTVNGEQFVTIAIGSNIMSFGLAH